MLNVRKKKSMKIFLTISLLVVLSGCSTMHCAEITPNNEPSSFVESGALDEFFLYNGFHKLGWSFSKEFGGWQLKGDEKVSSYWAKHLASGTGHIQAWVFLEGQEVVVYITGSSSGSAVAADTITNLETALSKQSPTIQIVLSKSYYMD